MEDGHVKEHLAVAVGTGHGSDLIEVVSLYSVTLVWRNRLQVGLWAAHLCFSL